MPRRSWEGGLLLDACFFSLPLHRWKTCAYARFHSYLISHFSCDFAIDYAIEFDCIPNHLLIERNCWLDASFFSLALVWFLVSCSFMSLLCFVSYSQLEHWWLIVFCLKLRNGIALFGLWCYQDYGLVSCVEYMHYGFSGSLLLYFFSRCYVQQTVTCRLSFPKHMFD